MQKELTLQYIYNSCYTIDFLDTFIVIDYFRGDLILPEDKQIIFITTHAHEDHYSPLIFSYPGSENALYILSDDVEAIESKNNILTISDSQKETESKKHAYDPEKVYRTKPNRTFEFGGLKVITFASTDQGISIYFELHGLRFFHSGDLNAWKWKSFSEEDQEKEVEDYVKILDQVSVHPIDIGFGVVDPRLEENAFIGPSLYLEKLHPQVFLPLHFRENFSITQDFADQYQKNFISKIQTIHAEKDRIIIK